MYLQILVQLCRLYLVDGLMYSLRLCCSYIHLFLQIALNINEHIDIVSPLWKWTKWGSQVFICRDHESSIKHCETWFMGELEGWGLHCESGGFHSQGVATSFRWGHEKVLVVARRGLLELVASSKWRPTKSREWWLLVGGGLQSSWWFLSRAYSGSHDYQVVACTIVVPSELDVKHFYIIEETTTKTNCWRKFLPWGFYLTSGVIVWSDYWCVVIMSLDSLWFMHC